jgi:hypothetical protein
MSNIVVKTDHSKPLSGLVTWTVQTDYVLEQWEPRGSEAYGWQLALDGAVQPFGWDHYNPKSFTIDTRKWPNGEHEISVSLRILQKTTSKNVGQNVVRVQVDNGGSAPVRSLSFDPEAAAPSAPFPHFTRTGKIVSSYGPDSFVPRGVFGLNPNAILRPQIHPTKLADEVTKAAINVAESGFYPNPYPRVDQTDAQWKASADKLYSDLLAVVVPLGLSVHLTGDDTCRIPQYLNNTINDPKANGRIRYCLSLANGMQRVFGIAMCDEVNTGGLWGSTWHPTDGRWLKKTPPIPDTAFAAVFEILNTPDRPPISWPAVAGSSVASELDWNQKAEYREVYWSLVAGYPLYLNSYSTAQLIHDGVERSVLGRAAARVGVPFVLQIGCNGPSYRKVGTNTQYDPAVDELLGPGHTPGQVSIQFWVGIAEGATGFRAYSLDQDGDKEDRKKPADARQRFTGTDPWETGVDRWAALSASHALIAELEPLILQPNDASPDLGPDFVTGVKRGTAGSLLIVANVSSVAQSVEFNIPASVKNSLRIRSIGGSVVRETVAGGLYRLLLAPDETIIWVFRAGSAPVDPCQSVRDELSVVRGQLASVTLELNQTKQKLEETEARLESTEAVALNCVNDCDRKFAAFKVFSEEMNR